MSTDVHPVKGFFVGLFALFIGMVVACAFTGLIFTHIRCGVRGTDATVTAAVSGLVVACVAGVFRLLRRRYGLLHAAAFGAVAGLVSASISWYTFFGSHAVGYQGPVFTGTPGLRFILLPLTGIIAGVLWSRTYDRFISGGAMPWVVACGLTVAPSSAIFLMVMKEGRTGDFFIAWLFGMYLSIPVCLVCGRLMARFSQVVRRTTGWTYLLRKTLIVGAFCGMAYVLIFSLVPGGIYTEIMSDKGGLPGRILIWTGVGILYAGFAVLIHAWLMRFFDKTPAPASLVRNEPS